MFIAVVPYTVLLLLIQAISLEAKSAAKNAMKTVNCVVDKQYKYDPKKLSGVHPESPLAHKLLDGLCGIEIGTASYAPFGLKTVNVGLTEDLDPQDYKLYKDHQIHVTGDYAKVDIGGDAEDLSLIADSAVDFVLHSHVWEHLPNPLIALEEWVRVTKDGGLIFIMVPHRNALSTDVTKNLTYISELVHFHKIGATAETRKNEGHRGHYTRFTPELLTNIMNWYNRRHDYKLSLVAFLEMDDKIRLGHTICWKVAKNPKTIEALGFVAKPNRFVKS